MTNLATKSTKKLIIKLSVAFVLLFAYFAATEVAQAQSYCNPYNYSYRCYMGRTNIYNSDRSIDYWNYTGYSTYPSNYTSSGFENNMWSAGDRVYVYAYMYGYYPYYYNVNLMIQVDWNDDGDFTGGIHKLGRVGFVTMQFCNP